MFHKVYTSLSTYKIYEVQFGRTVDEDYPPFLAFLSEGGIPEAKSGSKYITIVDNAPVFNEALRFADAKLDKKKATRAAKHLAEFSGITFKGKLLATDRDSQFASFKLSQKAKSTNYKCADGTYISLTAQEIAEVDSLMFDKQQHCFNTEKAISEAIDAATTQAELDAVVIQF